MDFDDVSLCSVPGSKEEGASKSLHVLHVPTEAMVTIFTLLDKLSLLSCMQVCRYWYCQIMSERRLWAVWLLSEYGIPPEVLERVVQACGGSVQQAVRAMQRYISLLIPRRVLGPTQHIVTRGYPYIHDLGGSGVIANIGSKHMLVQIPGKGFTVMRRDHTKILCVSDTCHDWVWNTHFKVVVYSPWAEFMVISSLKTKVVQGTKFVSYYWVSAGGSILALAPVPKASRRAETAMCSHCGLVVHVVLDPTEAGMRSPVVVVHGGQSTISGPTFLSECLRQVEFAVFGTEVFLTADGAYGTPGGNCCQVHYMYILGTMECANSESGGSLHLWKYVISSETELPEELQLMLVSPPIMLDLPFCPSHIAADESLLCVVTRSLSTVCLVHLSDLTCTVVELNVSADCLKRNPLVYMLPFRSVGAVGSLFSIFEVHEHCHGSHELGLQLVSTHTGKAISFVPEPECMPGGFYLISYDLLDGDVSAIVAGTHSCILTPVYIISNL